MSTAAGGTPSRVLVVGGTGFIGGHLTEILVARGAFVRVASRTGRWPWGTPPAGVEFVALDLADPPGGSSPAAAPAPALRNALGDVDTVVNCAGLLGAAGRPEAELRRVHVEGTERLCAALPPATRLVHVSTTGVLGPTGPTPLDESAPLRPSNAYERAKAAGEQRARALHASGRAVVIARPGLVYGPRDLHLAGFFRAIRDGRFRRIGRGDARWQPVHVRDLAGALADLALRAAPTGSVYHLGGSDSVTVTEFASRIATAIRGRIGRPALPTPLAFGAGLMLEALCLPFGVEPPLSRARVRTLTETRLYDSRKARRELGFAPAVSLAAGIAEAAAWYRDHGHL